MVETKEGGEVVADNCFVKLCEATTDISISVRTHAARLLVSNFLMSLSLCVLMFGSNSAEFW